MEYEYKFVKVALQGNALSADTPAEDHHRLIKQHASQGWRLVQVFSPSVGYQGCSAYFEIIFEKPRSGRIPD